MPCSIGYLLSRRELLKIISSVTCIQAPFSQHPSTFLYFHSFFPSKNRPIHLHLKVHSALYLADLQVRSLQPFLCWFVLDVCLYMDINFTYSPVIVIYIVQWCSLSHFHCLQGWNSEFLVVAW
ncbi:hypothetical protein BRADI_2g50403v3 [Brachypodium distachyon]|uniref:Uncharacterized protein n=1 Tax=Brachypodium distachyon TaxID=15368 RepID=A0A2K2DF49_BRADI|nr:hypothetical protein BRADI_2g50403v3 [Brachypodium distachyon]